MKQSTKDDLKKIVIHGSKVSVAAAKITVKAATVIAGKIIRAIAQ